VQLQSLLQRMSNPPKARIEYLCVMSCQYGTSLKEMDLSICPVAAKFYVERNHKGDSNDEDLARAIQDSLNMNPYTPYNPYAPSQAQPRGHRVCGRCKHEIGHGHYLSCMGIYWHPQCFRCCSCGHPIRETEVTILNFLS